MKTNSPKHVLFLAVALLLTGTAFSAESTPAPNAFSQAGRHASAASGEAAAAVSATAIGSSQIVASVVAVPVWMSGAVVNGSGRVLTASGEAAVRAGDAATRGAEKLWDFATGEVAARPPMARERAVPPAPLTQRKPQDPSPAEALRAKPASPVPAKGTAL